MNKTFLSVVFLAASGIYVAFANHALDGLAALAGRPSDKGEAALAEAAEPQATSVVPATQTPIAPAAITLTAPATAPSSIAPPAPRPTIVATAPLPQPMPMPLPRPEPSASVQQTQSAASPASTTGYRDGSYTGTDENAYYGRVEVQVTVAAGQISNVKVLDYPSDRRTSRYINGEALPILAQEVIQAQSAQIDTVSGATLTSGAYIRSLGNALRKAGSNA